MKRIAFILFFFFSFFAIAQAEFPSQPSAESQLQSQPSIPLPPGNYIETCKQCSFHDRVLSCSCNDRLGFPQNTSLSRPYLCDFIENIDGHLQCSSQKQSQSITRDVNAGPIWSQYDAQNKCPSTCNSVKGQWDGQWKTVEFGTNSVCECTWNK